MNTINLKGVLKNIGYSHKILDTEFNKANLLVTEENGKENLLSIKFKKFSNKYNENDEVSFKGNIRTYSQNLGDKNKVELYVFTYFDENETDEINSCYVDGRICKKTPIRKTQKGKDVVDFILANNLRNNGQCLNCYIPCVAWGKDAKLIDSKEIGDLVLLKGQLCSREYKKKISEEDFEIRVCHELNVQEVCENDAIPSN